MTEDIKGCYLYSKANYSIRILYDGDTIMLPPFANKVKIADESKLGKLPDKVRKVSMSSSTDTKIKKSKVDGGGK